MQIEIDDNPNCRGSGQYVFNELEAAKPVTGILAELRGVEALCDVIGVDTGGQWAQAHAQKIADSGAGFAWIIFGGVWGIRLRPRESEEGPWDFQNKNEWGEPFKIYGEEKDIIFGNIKSAV